MNDTPDLSRFIAENISYDDGLLRWIKSSNGRKVGDKVGSPATNGYLRVEILGKKYAVHRLVYFMHHGYMPTVIDHIDGNRTNNRIENLREADKAKNTCNSKVSARNKSGEKGVYFHKASKKWCAQVEMQGIKSAELFNSFEDAALFARFKREEMHGEFARHV